nr:glycogenin [Mycoleptodonoides aitchisonii]
MDTPYAFVTLVTSDQYLPGALAVAASLKDLHPSPAVDPEVNFQTVCLVTPETVNVSSIKLLRRTFDLVIGVEVIEQEDVTGLQLLGRPDLHHVLTKLHIFRLAQYTKIIFLDADVLPIRPMSHLFTTEHEFSAVPDVGWPDIFNSGVLVFSPGDDKFTELMGLLKTKGSWDGGDQGLLNEWRGGNWNRLSFTYAPAYERYGSQISAIHFIGPNKPWVSIPYRAPGTKSAQSATVDTAGYNQTGQRIATYNYDSLVDRWYDVYDRHYRSDLPSARADFELTRYESAWDTGSGFGAEIQPPQTSASGPGGAIGLEDLRKIAVEGISSYNAAAQERPNEGEYRSMPLDGRVDLMRRKKEHKDELSDQGAQHAGGPGHGDDQNLTPKQTFRQLEGGAEYRMETLPTPGPDEVPPTPYHHNMLLPPSAPPTPGQENAPAQYPYHPPEQTDYNNAGGEQIREQWSQDQHTYIAHQPQPQHYHSHPQQHHEGDNRRFEHGERRDGSNAQEDPHTSLQQPEHQHHDPARHAANQQAPTSPQSNQHQHHSHSPTHHHHHHHHYRHPPQRPSSPPKMEWNPAIEPPPKTPPPLSAFPADTYFPNIWDQAPSLRHDATFQSYPHDTSVPQSDVFFHPPPPSEIPEQLLREGQYEHVIGRPTENSPGSPPVPPTPDRNKIHPIFPWEEKPRHAPRRVFPVSDSPPPSAQFIEEVTSPKLSANDSPDRPILHLQTPSPPVGLPFSLTYSNAWDTVPSIQRYASKLVRPNQGIVRPPPPNFERDDGWRQWEKERERVFQERQDASSMDGDDEDDGDDDERPDGGDESSRERGDGHRSRAESNASLTRGNKKYQGRGVQTVPVETRSTGVQVSVWAEGVASHGSRAGKPSRGSGVSSGRGWTPLSSGLLPPVTMSELKVEHEQRASHTPMIHHHHTGTMPFPSKSSPTGLRSPQTLGSPRTYSPPKVATPPKVTSPPRVISPKHTLSPKVTSPNTASPRRLSYTQARKTSSSSNPSSKPVSPVVGPMSTPPPQHQGTHSPKLTRLSSPFSPPLARTPSNDTTFTSSPSTQGPVITPENTPLMGASKKGGRVWDPARGVDVFKRTSEEVLARFLRSGSFEDEDGQKRHS